MARSRAIPRQRQSLQRPKFEVYPGASLSPPASKSFVNCPPKASEICERWFFESSSYLSDPSIETDAQIFTLKVSEVIESRIENWKVPQRKNLVFMCWLWCGMTDSWNRDIEEICKETLDAKERWESSQFYPRSRNARGPDNSARSCSCMR